MKATRAHLTSVTILALLLLLAVGGQSTKAQPYPPLVGSLSSETSSTSPPVGSTATLSATVLDASGRPVAGAEVLFQIAVQPGTTATFANGLTQITVLTDANGVARAILSVGSTSGTIVVTMTSGDKASQLTLQVQPAAVPAAGGPPPKETDGGLAVWQAALLAAFVASLLIGSAMVIRRRT